MKTLYEITGKINDLNTLLVNRREYDSLVAAANTKPEIDPCINGSCSCWTHLDKTEQNTMCWQPISTAPINGSNILTRTKVGAETTIREAQFSGQFDSNGDPIFRVPITNNLCCAQEWMPVPSFME